MLVASLCAPMRAGVRACSVHAYAAACVRAYSERALDREGEDCTALQVAFSMLLGFASILTDVNVPGVHGRVHDAKTASK